MQLAFSGLVLVFSLVSIVLVAFRRITVDNLPCGRAVSVALSGRAAAPGQPAGWADLCTRTARQAVLAPTSMALLALIWFGWALSRTLRATRAGQAGPASPSPR